jgi:hypothetical protein
MKAARFVAAGSAWVFVAAVVLQVFLAGVGIFGAGTMEGHFGLGYLIPILALAVLIVLVVARARSAVVPAVVLVVLTGVQTILPWFRLEAPYVAALHPVNALAIGLLGYVIARRATAFARAADQTAPAESAQPVAHAI